MESFMSGVNPFSKKNRIVMAISMACALGMTVYGIREQNICAERVVQREGLASVLNRYDNNHNGQLDPFEKEIIWGDYEWPKEKERLDKYSPTNFILRKVGIYSS